MLIRNFKKEDLKSVEDIFKMYWTDPEFIERLSLKLKWAIENSLEYLEKKYIFFVAEENGEVVGIVGSRVAPEHMKEYTRTANPAELYIIAAKYKGIGVGKVIKDKILDENAKKGFTEIVLYSPDSHKDSWGFYDSSGFDRFGPALAPDGEPGMIWGKMLI